MNYRQATLLAEKLRAQGMHAIVRTFGWGRWEVNAQVTSPNEPIRIVTYKRGEEVNEMETKHQKLIEQEAKWEKAHNLPAGCLEAIRQNPSPARVAEIIANVRDLATGDRQLTGTEGYHN